MSRRPYAMLPSFLSPEMGQSFENFLSPVNASLGNLRDSIFSPRTDVRECGDHYAISVDLPGVAIEDIDVEVNDGILMIQGSRKGKSTEEEDGFQRVERFMGTFQRRFALPDNVDSEAVSANSVDGVLEVRVPKLPERAPRKIKVQTESGARFRRETADQEQSSDRSKGAEHTQSAEATHTQEA